MPRVHVDADRCVGSGQCVMTAPAVFDLRDTDGTAFPVVETIGDEHVSDVEHAESVCPARAIRLIAT